MAKIVLFLAIVPLAAAQPGAGSADRVAPVEAASAKLPGDGLVVKSLQLLVPSAPTRLTESERFHQYAANTFGVIPIISEAASAGLSQWIDSPPEWGQGAAGFGKRFGNDLAYNALRNTITYTTSIALHEDNRYFLSGKRTIRGRIVHALMSPLGAHHNGGRDSFSFSSAAGIVGANMISQGWAPPRWRGAGNIGTNIGWTLAGTAALNLFREFVPDLIQSLRK